MQKITSVVELRNAISLLEKKKADDSLILKQDIHNALESLKPVNIIKSTFTDLASSQEVRDNILSTALGMTAGFLSKRLIVGATNNPFKKMFGSIIQMGISKIVSKKSEGKGISFIKKIFNKRTEEPVGMDH